MVRRQERKGLRPPPSGVVSFGFDHRRLKLHRSDEPCPIHSQETLTVSVVP
jgi:hypothetical protein